MAYDIYSLDSIVLRSEPIGEWDRAFLLLTREYGLVHVKAIGIDKNGSKRKGYSVRFRRFQAHIVHGRSGYRLTSAESSQAGYYSFPLHSYIVLCRLGAIYENILPAGSGGEKVFEFFTSLFDYLSLNLITKKESEAVFISGALAIMSILGFREGGENLSNSFWLDIYNKNKNDPALLHGLFKEFEDIVMLNGLPPML